MTCACLARLVRTQTWNRKLRKVRNNGHPIKGKAAWALGTFSVTPSPNGRSGLEFVQVWGNPKQIGALFGIYAAPLEGSRFAVAMACRDLKRWFGDTLNSLSDR